MMPSNVLRSRRFEFSPRLICRKTGVSCAAAAVLVMVGCSGPNPFPTAQVTGRVLLDGKPVAGADVTFQRQGAPRFSTGRSDQQGVYTLTTFDTNDGAIVGENSVTVTMPAISSEKELPDSPMTDEYYDLLKESRQAVAKQVIPKHYTDPTTTDLKVTVLSGDNELDLKMQSNPK